MCVDISILYVPWLAYGLCQFAYISASSPYWAKCSEFLNAANKVNITWRACKTIV